MTSLAKFHSFANFSPPKTKNILHLFLTPFLWKRTNQIKICVKFEKHKLRERLNRYSAGEICDTQSLVLSKPMQERVFDIRGASGEFPFGEHGYWTDPWRGRADRGREEGAGGGKRCVEDSHFFFADDLDWDLGDMVVRSSWCWNSDGCGLIGGCGGCGGERLGGWLGVWLGHHLKEGTCGVVLLKKI